MFMGQQDEEAKALYLAHKERVPENDKSREHDIA
jgi:hypothetical protein